VAGKKSQALTRDNDDELLIIQKEFAGFDDTKERLDLLALDKKATWSSSKTSLMIPGATSSGRR
jgi:hypothetical protein